SWKTTFQRSHRPYADWQHGAERQTSDAEQGEHKRNVRPSAQNKPDHAGERDDKEKRAGFNHRPKDVRKRIHYAEYHPATSAARPGYHRCAANARFASHYVTRRLAEAGKAIGRHAQDKRAAACYDSGHERFKCMPRCCARLLVAMAGRPRWASLSGCIPTDRLHSSGCCDDRDHFCRSRALSVFSSTAEIGYSYPSDRGDAVRFLSADAKRLVSASSQPVGDSASEVSRNWPITGRVPRG